MHGAGESESLGKEKEGRKQVISLASGGKDVGGGKEKGQHPPKTLFCQPGRRGTKGKM